MVGLGVLIGAWIAARYIERFGIPRDETYRLATRLVVAGVVGARLTWDITHFDQIDSPLDLIAVWQGGLQFSGGFIAAVAIAYPTFRRWSRVLRWRAIDGFAYGLTIGLALGRVGCYSVGEHFGSASSWLLAVRFDGGNPREPAAIGDTFHHTALYEFLYLLVLFGIMTWLARRRPAPGTLIGVFCRVLRHGAVPVGLPPGERRHRPRPHRRPMAHGDASDCRPLDLQMGPARSVSWRGARGRRGRWRRRPGRRPRRGRARRVGGGWP